MTWIFWIAVALIGYTYAGYLGWLWLRTRLRPLQVTKKTIEPFVSILMVVRDEERVLAAKIQNLLALEYPPDRMELVIVSDGSTDRTEAILREQARNPRVITVLNQLSRGKAAGLNDGIQFAHGEIMVFTDARQKIEEGALRVLIENFADKDVGCASGELMLGNPDRGEQSDGMGLYWRVEKKVRELESASGSVVGVTGAFYGIRRDLLGPIPPEILLDDVFIPMQAVRAGKRVVFESQARVWDVPDLGRRREFRRKVRTLSGNYQLLQLAPWLLSSTNPIRFEFISHKLMRLVVPFALVAALLATISLQHPVYRIALLVQLAFYALSLLAVMPLKRGVVASGANAAFTFVLLNTAAVVAFANFLTGRKPAWSR